ncbi:TauD/TfdA family dioxygenase [Microcystis sp. BLCC-F210]|uniref:TauD/TfdA family dioxygenase n=1 Tax=Microcystis sp. BLCC-F210 TaxID=3342751 RepID=UPI0035C8C74C
MTIAHSLMDAKAPDVQDQICKEINEKGYCLRRLPPEFDKEDIGNLLATVNLGKLVRHPLSDDSGAVAIQFKPGVNYINTTYLASGMHTDGSFSSQKIGIVVMYCQQSIKGQGTTKLLEFRKALQHLKQVNPEDVNYLYDPTTLGVYRKGQRACGPILSQNADGRLQVRYRGDTGDDTAQIDVHPKARRIVNQLREFVEDEANQILFSLEPGSLLLLDNTALLHGRTAFDPTKPRVLHRWWFDGCAPGLQLGFKLTP